MIEPYDTWRRGKVICPYCGEVDEALSAGVGDKSGKCKKCGQWFKLEQIPVILFTTRKAPCLNEGKHGWQGMPQLKDTFPNARHCPFCLKTEYNPDLEGDTNG